MDYSGDCGQGEKQTKYNFKEELTAIIDELIREVKERGGKDFQRVLRLPLIERKHR